MSKFGNFLLMKFEKKSTSLFLHKKKNQIFFFDKAIKRYRYHTAMTSVDTNVGAFYFGIKTNNYEYVKNALDSMDQMDIGVLHQSIRYQIYDFVELLFKKGNLNIIKKIISSTKPHEPPIYIECHTYFKNIQKSISLFHLYEVDLIKLYRVVIATGNVQILEHMKNEGIFKNQEKIWSIKTEQWVITDALNAAANQKNYLSPQMHEYLLSISDKNKESTFIF